MCDCNNHKLLYPDAIHSPHMSNLAMCKLWPFAGSSLAITRVRVTITAASATEDSSVDL